MSQENVEVVRHQFQAFRDGGLDEAAKYWHPDIEWRAVEGAADDVGIIRGEGPLRRYYQDWIDTMDEMEAHVEEVLFHGGERVAAVVRNSGRGRASGVLTEGRYYVACTVRDGRIVSGREYETRAQALQAVGLPTLSLPAPLPPPGLRANDSIELHLCGCSRVAKSCGGGHLCRTRSARGRTGAGSVHTGRKCQEVRAAASR